MTNGDSSSLSNASRTSLRIPASKRQTPTALLATQNARRAPVPASPWETPLATCPLLSVAPASGRVGVIMNPSPPVAECGKAGQRRRRRGSVGEVEAGGQRGGATERVKDIHPKGAPQAVETPYEKRGARVRRQPVQLRPSGCSRTLQSDQLPQRNASATPRVGAIPTGAVAATVTPADAAAPAAAAMIVLAVAVTPRGHPPAPPGSGRHKLAPSPTRYPRAKGHCVHGHPRRCRCPPRHRSTRGEGKYGDTAARVARHYPPPTTADV